MCGRSDPHSRVPCSCCKGAFIFEEALHINQKLASQPIQPNTKEREFRRVPATTGCGVEIFSQLFGLHSGRDCLPAVFDVRAASVHCTALPLAVPLVKPLHLWSHSSVPWPSFPITCPFHPLSLHPATSREATKQLQPTPQVCRPHLHHCWRSRDCRFV